jgi:hypothetical protein
VTYRLLLAFHIAAGATALIAAVGALGTLKGGRWHVRAGRMFVVAMLVVFLTAVPMTLLRPNLFLFLVAVFSVYLVLTGWLRARNRSGVPTAAEWVAATGMVGSTIAALTAFTVVNVRLEPAFVVWLAPTVLLTPLIFYWVARVQRSEPVPTRR